MRIKVPVVPASFFGMEHAVTTAVLYLPTVAGSFVTAIIAAALGHADWDQVFFGSGLFSWLAIESVLVSRMLTGPELAAALRPTLGIQLAPAPVGAVAYLSVTHGPPDVFAHALLGYGLLQSLILLRLLPWIGAGGSRRRQDRHGPACDARKAVREDRGLSPLGAPLPRKVRSSSRALLWRSSAPVSSNSRCSLFD
jgi:tellurite resistance protein TehA-like permease